MSTEGWIFMVGFRIFDVGLLILWLVWFFRLRDDGDDSPDDGGPGGGGPGNGPRDGDGGGGLLIRDGHFDQGSRRRDGHRAGRSRARRGSIPPVRGPLPARVRRPSGPVPVRRP